MSSDTVSAIIVWIVIGLIAGFLASLIVGGGLGLFGALVAGLVGSIVGGFLARAFNMRLRLGSAIAEQIIVSTVGAVVVIIIARIIT